MKFTDMKRTGNEMKRYREKTIRRVVKLDFERHFLAKSENKQRTKDIALHKFYLNFRSLQPCLLKG